MSFPQEPSQQPLQWHYLQFDDPNFQINGTAVVFIIVVISSAILVASLLYVYSRWLCDSIPTSVVRLSPPLGLRQEKINKLPVVMYKVTSNMFGDAECCICLGIFVNEERVKVMPSCRHCFHSECVDKWLMVHSSCPICRSSIRVEVDSPV